jgi:hypothetical protein
MDPQQKIKFFFKKNNIDFLRNIDEILKKRGYQKKEKS